jgi:hypothetical protein
MIDKSRLVHVVFVNPDGKKMWFVKTDRRIDPKSGQAFTLPVIDDDPHNSVPMTFEYADVSKRLWSNPPFNLNVRLALAAGPTAEFIDTGDEPSPTGSWEHRDHFVHCDETGALVDSLDSSHVFLVRAVHTPEGKMFCLRADQPSLTHPSVFSTLAEGPRFCVEKCFALGFSHTPQVNPHLEARRQEAQRQAQRAANARYANVRPGDRPR